MARKSKTKKQSIKKRKEKQGINPGIYVLVASILFFIGLFYLHSHPELYLKPTNDTPKFLHIINGNSQEKRVFEMKDDQIIIEEGALGNVKIVIENGRACIMESTCPNQTCVKSGWISAIGESVTCAPNQVLIRIQGSTESIVPGFYSE
jgi:hypothetical protein